MGHVWHFFVAKLDQQLPILGGIAHAIGCVVFNGGWWWVFVGQQGFESLGVHGFEVIRIPAQLVYVFCVQTIFRDVFNQGTAPGG